MQDEVIVNTLDEGESNVEPAVAVQRVRELELEVLLEIDLSSQSPAGEAMWRAVDRPTPPRPVSVERQVDRSDDRSSDLAVHGRRLLVEAKAADGAFERGQPESYKREAQRSGAATIVVAPNTFVKRYRGEIAANFTAHIEVEELAGILARAAMDATDELAVSWRSRADMYRRFAQPAVRGNPDVDRAAFAHHYDSEARRLTAGRVKLQAETLRNRSSAFVGYAPGFPAGRPLSLQHKLTFGQLDLRVPGWTRAALEARLAALGPDHRPPAHWCVGSPRNAHKDPRTGEPAPVLRFELTVVPLPPPPPPYEAVLPTLRKAIEAANELGLWLQGGGQRLLTSGPDRQTVLAMLAEAAHLARDLGLQGTSEAIEYARRIASARQ